ncbi:MAG: FAD-dependent thymidylate synthase [Candidatus Cloacimonadota bacterium]|nr:FAD-dependent thymidylate synthase [Candidatus Cloacimonadota bacterium]
MQVKLAGFNIDFDQIKDFSNCLKKLNNLKAIKDKFEKIQFTPETISAAYARISRSQKSVDELRKQSVEDVEKARKSNQKIVFDMGHSSIAEHAVFNLDIIGISRYLTEFVQRTRLASFTEKSQRYVTLHGDYVLPAEIKNDLEFRNEFIKIIEIQNQAYLEFFENLKDYYFKQNENYSSPQKLSKRELEGKAKEDSRYVLSLATQAQMGMTINARSVERLLKRLYAIPFKEATELADKIYNEVKSVAPSLIKYIKPSEYDRSRYKIYTASHFEPNSDGYKNKLLNYTDNCDEKVLATLLFRKTGNSFEDLLNRVKQMSLQEKRNHILESLENIESYDSLPREFELAEFIFQLNISASCFAQLKRHRMSTIITSDYKTDYGYTIPESIIAIGKQEEFTQIIGETEKFYSKLAKTYPEIKNYILTNAHHKLVIFKLNLRELCNFARLREDRNAQWEIRELAHWIVAECKKVAPLTTMLICGKDEFEKVYRNVYIKE